MCFRRRMRTLKGRPTRGPDPARAVHLGRVRQRERLGFGRQGAASAGLKTRLIMLQRIIDGITYNTDISTKVARWETVSYLGHAGEIRTLYVRAARGPSS